MKNTKTSELENKLHAIQDEVSLSSYIQTIENTTYSSFQEYYSSLTSSFDKSKLIEDSGIERSYCYHILNGTKKPSRDKILRLCIAAHFNTEQTKRALEISKEGILYAKSSRDAIIQYAINQKLSVIDTNILLDQHHENSLD
jgi:RNase P/RNase MRP subunit p30